MVERPGDAPVLGSGGSGRWSERAVSVIIRASLGSLAGGTMRLHFILMISPDPTASTGFYRKVFGCTPRVESAEGRGYVEFRFGATTLAIRGIDPDLIASHGLEPNPSSLGWGAFFVFSVDNFDQVLGRVRAAGFPILDGEFEQKGRRYFALKDPAGYVLEISEETYGATA